MKYDIITVIGARPQFIKAASVSGLLRKSGIIESILHTGQHYDKNMSSIFFQELGIPEPRWNLDVGSGAHGEQTAKMLTGIEEILTKHRPSLVLLYGDTTSTLAGALAAVKMGIPIAHIEAGLRRYNLGIPEEVNRRLTDHVSSILFAPTKTAQKNLLEEGIVNGVHLVGDVMLDLALDAQRGEGYESVPTKYGVVSGRYMYATIHRQENTDHPGKARMIWDSISAMARDGISVVLPLHPRTRKKFTTLGIDIENHPESLKILDPVSYRESISLLGNSRLVATDSGGVQRESCFLGVPCVIVNFSTGWNEVVTGGNAVVVGEDYSRLESILRSVWLSPTRGVNIKSEFGDGMATIRIVQELKRYLETNCLS